MADGVYGDRDGSTSSGQNIGLVKAVDVARQQPLQTASNSVQFAAFGETTLAAGELERLVLAVPMGIATALVRKAYYFVPLAMSDRANEGEHRGGAEETMVAPAFSPELSEQAICHRNVTLEAVEGVFISTRLLNDRFALAFEFFINVGHAFVETVGVPEAFNALVWGQALKDVRGETSQDAWELRAQAVGRSASQGRHGTLVGGQPTIDEKAKTEYLEAAFADTVAIYQLSLSVDFNYSELREREYPLLAPQPLAERLRLAAKLFPPNPSYEFAIRYRRRA